MTEIHGFRKHRTDGSPCWCEPEVTYVYTNTLHRVAIKMDNYFAKYPTEKYGTYVSSLLQAPNMEGNYILEMRRKDV